MLTVLYIAFAVLGCGYVIVSALTGHLLDVLGDAGHETGGNGHGEAGSAYGVEGTGHGAASHAGDAGAAAFHYPFFSPLALATLFAALGGFGLIAKHGLRATDGVSLIVAIPAAVATAYAITYVGWRLVSGSRGTSQIRTADLAGATAEVLTPIPAHGLGEVAAMVAGQRYTGPAREVEGRAVPRGARVTVVEVLGSTLVVTTSPGKRGA
jgi:membrane protein implicated in regulation of membrane protease activity